MRTSATSWGSRRRPRSRALGERWSMGTDSGYRAGPRGVVTAPSASFQSHRQWPTTICKQPGRPESSSGGGGRSAAALCCCSLLVLWQSSGPGRTSSQALRGCFEMAWMELGLLGGEIRERHSPQSSSLPSKDTAAGQGASWQGSELFAELFATKAKPSPSWLGRPTQRSLHLRSKPLLMAKVRKDDPQEGTTLESA